ncbi:hypothetical protein ACSQ67_000218 [Phaseolus vulgaris]
MLLRGNRHGEELPRHLRPQKRQGRRSLGPRQQAPSRPPYDAAVSLKTLAARFGEVTDFSAYANRHAFVHLPQWVLHERRERRSLDILERKGVVTPSEPYTCGVCGRKCKTHMDLKKHFKQLHQREREKKLNRLKSLKGKKKRDRFKERFLRGNHKYNEAARTLLVPKVGYGLAAELRRAGVFVKTVEDKPQAADWALKRQMVHSMSRGIDWLFLVSDDSDFSEMLRRAREADLGTVVVGDWDRALGRHADLWVPWSAVENGEVDLVPKRKKRTEHGFQNGHDRKNMLPQQKLSYTVTKEVYRGKLMCSLELKEKQLSNKKYKIQNKERKIVAAPHLMPKFITAAWNYNSR